MNSGLTLHLMILILLQKLLHSTSYSLRRNESTMPARNNAYNSSGTDLVCKYPHIIQIEIWLNSIVVKLETSQHEHEYEPYCMKEKAHRFSKNITILNGKDRS